MNQRPILILGIGNILFRDEGIGIHVVNKMQEMGLPSNVEALDGGMLATSFMYIIEKRKKVIVIDAMQMGGKPGTIYRLTEQEFYTKRKGHPRTTQETEFEDSLLATHVMKTNPEKIIFIGIEPEDMGEKDLKLDMDVTPTLKAKMPEIIEMVIKEINE